MLFSNYKIELVFKDMDKDISYYFNYIIFLVDALVQVDAQSSFFKQCELHLTNSALESLSKVNIPSMYKGEPCQRAHFH